MNEIPAAGETFRGDDGTISTVLPANYGQDYEASEGELEEYAEYIGIDPVNEPELMWIAQEGLRAPLPDGWRACQTNDNEVYYFNFHTGDSLWDHPMDEHYKEKVINERAKHRSGGGGGGGGKGSGGVATALGGAGGTRTGTTKALTDSLFLKPSGNTGGPLSINTTPSMPSDDGASAPRPAPDVSDILNLASTASSLGPGGAKGSPAPFKLKETEAALRKRLEEQNEMQLRALRIDYGKREDAERQRLEEAKSRLQRELDSAWERDKLSTAGDRGGGDTHGTATSTATQRRLQTAREVKQIEESWKTRLHDVSTRVQELQAKVDMQQQTLQNCVHPPPEELKKTLEARNAAEVAQLREATRKQNEVALQRLKSEHAGEQAKASAKSAEMVAAAEKLVESTVAQKMEERKLHNAAMLAALQAAVDSRQTELAAKGKAATETQETTATEAAPKQLGLSEQDKAAIAAAQAAADAEVADVKKTNALALTRLREGYEMRKREKEASAAAYSRSNSPRASSTMQIPTCGSSRATSNNSFSVNAISPTEQARLDEEDQKLKDNADEAARIYEEETKLMVANREAGRPLTAAPLPAAAASVSAEAVAALGRTATQNQRARDAENARHAMSIKQLEAKHEQTVRLAKAQHDKAMAAGSSGGTSSASSGSAVTFNPRQHPSFTAQLNARKRSWIRDHPAPSMEMPTLTPIPTLPVATMSTTMAAATMPDAEEQAKIVKTRLVQLREELGRKFDREVQALQLSKESEIAAWQKEYRTTRLAEVQAAMAALKKEKDAEVERAKAKAKEQAEASATAAAAAAAAASSARKEAEQKATASANAKLKMLQESLQAIEAEADNGEKENKAAIAALESEIARLDAVLLQLTRDVEAEEKRRAEQQAKAAAVAAETEVLLKKRSETTAPVSAVPSPALFIKDTDAEAEESELRARWSGLLKSLRDAIQQERETYDRMIPENHISTSNQVVTQTAQTEPVSEASLPPNITVNARPPCPSSSPSLQGGGSNHSRTAPLSSLSLGFATPLQRPPLSASSEYRGYLAANPALHQQDARLSVPPPSYPREQQRLLQMEYSQLSPSWAVPNGAVSLATAAGSGGGGIESSFMSGSLGDGGVGIGGTHHYDAATGFPWGIANSDGGSVPNARVAFTMPCYSGSADDSRFLPMTQRSQCVLDPSGMIAQGQRPLSARVGGVRETTPRVEDKGRGGDGEDDDQAMRLAALQVAVRERRHELQRQRREMVQLREEWKADMQLCKQREDRIQARKLRAVKEVLEERARRLNEEVLEVKAMQYEVQNEVRRYRQWVQQQQMDADASRSNTGNTMARYAFGGGDANEENQIRCAYSTPAATADVVGLLESIVTRTERLEKLLMRNARSPFSKTPSPGRDIARR